MDDKTELEKIKAEIESKQEKKGKYDKKLIELLSREMQFKKI